MGQSTRKARSDDMLLAAYSVENLRNDDLFFPSARRVTGTFTLVFGIRDHEKNEHLIHQMQWRYFR
jgi:hypothetical protein